MPLTRNQIDERIEAIKTEADPRSRFYGALLNWPDVPINLPFWPFSEIKGVGLWHYGIGLSDDWVFDTGAGMSSFDGHSQERHFVGGVEHKLFPRKVVIERLIHAVECFAGWEYNVLGWNCEHLARLIATGEAKCYPVPINNTNVVAEQTFLHFLSSESQP